jgi:signal recognition particle subunit SRP72
MSTKNHHENRLKLTYARVPDLSTRQIAQNNKIATTLNPPNPYLTHRIFESVAILPKTDKLFQYQADLIQENRLALDLLVLKLSSVVKSTKEIYAASPSPTVAPHTNKISVLYAAAHAQNQLGKLALQQIAPLVMNRPFDIGLVLTIIQLYMLTNNPGSATTVLESLLKRLADSSSPIDQDITLAPGLVATLVSLYTCQGRKSQIQATLAKAASYWRHKSKPPIHLLEAAGLALLQSQVPDHQDLSMEIFSSLRSLDPTSRLATAGYVVAHTFTSSDSSAPPPEVNTLTSVPRLTAGIDAAVLEAMGIPSRTTGTIAPAASASRKRALDEKPKPAKKRVRKSRLPKAYDPAKPPDPERWLPLRDRSSYKPKGKKGRQKAAALTQGGVSADGGGATGAAKVVSEGVIKAGNAPVKSKKKKGKK